MLGEGVEVHLPRGEHQLSFNLWCHQASDGRLLHRRFCVLVDEHRVYGLLHDPVGALAQRWHNADGRLLGAQNHHDLDKIMVNACRDTLNQQWVYNFTTGQCKLEGHSAEMALAISRAFPRMTLRRSPT